MRFITGPLTIVVMIVANTAHASLGPFSFSQGSNSLTLTDGDRNLLDATPSALPLPRVRWGPFRTNDFSGAGGLPNLSIDINNGGSLLAMQKVTVQYRDSPPPTSPNAIRLLDLTNRDGNPDMEIRITNVTVPAVIDGTSTPDDFMITASSCLTYVQDGVQQFQICAIPEPSAFLLGCLCVAIVGFRRVLKKRTKN